MTKQERFQQKQWGKIVARAWADAEFKERLLADPQVVLREHGIETAPGIEFKIMEGEPGVQHLVLPPKPSEEMSEEDLVPTAVGYCKRLIRSPSFASATAYVGTAQVQTALAGSGR